MKKRLIGIVIIFSMCAAIAGCSHAGDDQTEKDTTVMEVETETIAEDATTSMHAGKTTLTYIGHASVKIVAKDGTVIYIDRNYRDDYADEADYILVTHAHDDHTPHRNVKLKESGVLLTYKETLHDGIYESYDFGNVQIEAVAAGGNANHDIKYCVGYVITVDGIKIYHAGDTSMIEQMALLSTKEIDYAMYPIDGIYNMDAVEATDVANLVAAKYNIPIHEFDSSNTKKSDNFTPNGRLILGYGETIIIGK